MADEPLHRMPDELTVSLAELTAVMFELEKVLRALVEDGAQDLADAVDGVIGRMTRWIWPLLGELEDQDGYDG